MTTQLCIAPHRDNPPPALGGLRLCAGHMAALEDALTGPSAHDDPTIDCVWGVRDGTRVAVCDTQHAAIATIVGIGQDRALQRGGYAEVAIADHLVCGDGTTWWSPADYRPGGIARDWLALERRGRALRTGEAAPCVTGSAEAELPIDPRLADLRSSIPFQLLSWANTHADALRTTPPPFGASVHQLAAWLARYTDWSAAQEWAGDYLGELAAIRRRARNLIDLPQPRRTVVGQCLERRDGQRCTGQLFTIEREPNDPTPVTIECDACPAIYDSTQWKRLGKRLERAA